MRPVTKPMRLRLAHVSLQFSDTNAQHTHDIEKIFTRGYDAITGTEAGAGAGNTLRELKRLAKKYGYRLVPPTRYDTWVAVKKSLIAKRSWRSGSVFALWRSSKAGYNPPGRWGDKGIVWASFSLGDVYGDVSVGAIHSLTWGGTGTDARKNASDVTYAEAMRGWTKEHAKGKRVAFIGGDFNRRDDKNDVFMGVAPLTTCWDELKKWPNTGHGNIDAIASHDADRRVKCVGAQVFNDKRLFLHTDHFLIEAVYEIQPK